MSACSQLVFWSPFQWLTSRQSLLFFLFYIWSFQVGVFKLILVAALIGVFNPPLMCGVLNLVLLLKLVVICFCYFPLRAQLRSLKNIDFTVMTMLARGTNSHEIYFKMYSF